MKEHSLIQTIFDSENTGLELDYTYYKTPVWRKRRDQGHSLQGPVHLGRLAHLSHPRKKYLISLLENHTLLVVQFFEVSVFKSATPIIRKV